MPLIYTKWWAYPDIAYQIIREARFKHLFDKMKTSTKSLSVELIQTVEEAWVAFTKSKFKDHAPASLDEYHAFVEKYKNGAIPEAKDEPKYDLFVKTAVSGMNPRHPEEV